MAFAVESAELAAFLRGRGITYKDMEILGFDPRETYRILYETTHTTLRLADRIVCALGCPEVFHTGELNIVDVVIGGQKAGEANGEVAVSYPNG